MSNFLQALPAGAVPAHLQQYASTANRDELSAGIGASFAVFSYKGKVWATKYQGESKILMRPDGDGPTNSIDVVIVKASPHISKIFYEKGYSEGDVAPPDCWSSTGITPDPASPKKQANTCAGCRWNAFGSAALLRQSSDGSGKGKACADSKRLAVVPGGDIPNEGFNGPMLLRAPAASLRAVSRYADDLQKHGYPYFGVVTKISFDPQSAHPEFVLTPVRALTAEEFQEVLAYRGELGDGKGEDERLERLLTAQVTEATHEPPAQQDKPVDAAALFAANNKTPEHIQQAMAQPAAQPAATQEGSPAPAKPNPPPAPRKPTPPPPPPKKTRPIAYDVNEGVRFSYYADTGEFIEYLEDEPAAATAAPADPAPAAPEVTQDAVTTSAESFDDVLDGLLAKG